MKKTLIWLLTACLIAGSCILPASAKGSPALVGISIQDKIDDVVDDIYNGEYVPPEDVPKYPTAYQVLDNVTFVSAGGFHTAAITQDGTLYTWGSNSDGQLGIGHTDSVDGPQKVMEDVSFVSAGEDCTAAVKKDGTLWTFGENDRGQLGNGTRTASAAPVQILDNVKSICRDEEYAAIRTDGTLWVWGEGNSRLFSSLLPAGTDLLRPVQLMEDVIDVACSGHIAVVKADHTLWIWGTNYHGQVGNGAHSDIDLSAPVQIMSDVQQVDVGYEHTIALKTDGSVWGWGANSSGQLGKREIKDNQYSFYTATWDVWITEDCRMEPVTIGRASGVNVEEYISDWARADVEAARAAGLIPSLTGAPAYGDSITREQFAQLVVQFLETALGQALPAAPADTFTDCRNPAVLKAYAAGVISGVGAGKFSPEATTNREQIATMINRAIDYYNAQTGEDLAPAAPDLSGFVDAGAVSAWAADSMGRLVANKIMAGTSVIALQPKGYCTVEQSIVLLYRLYQTL